MSNVDTSRADVRQARTNNLNGIEAPPVHLSTAGPAAGPAAHIIGDPLALGLSSFGISVGVVGSVNAGLVDVRVAPVTFAVMIASGFVTQLLAGFLAFRRGETFVGVVFTAFSGFWLGITLLLAVFAPQIARSGGSVGQALGLYLLAWAIISTFIWVASLVTTKMNGVIFGIGTAALYVLAFAGFTNSDGLTKIGGWLQILTGIGLFYLSAATIVNEMHARRLLPAP